MFGGISTTCDPLVEFCKNSPSEAAKLIRKLMNNDSDYLYRYADRHNGLLKKEDKKNLP